MALLIKTISIAGAVVYQNDQIENGARLDFPNAELAKVSDFPPDDDKTLTITSSVEIKGENIIDVNSDGVDIDLPDAVVMTGGEITPNDDGTINMAAVEIQGNAVDINADGMREKLESIGISIIEKMEKEV